MIIHVPKLTKKAKAPDFCLPNQDGQSICLADFLGKKVVLFFYPKDDTPTCTNEVCNLRDNFAVLKKKGLVLLGISKDPVQSHQKFVKKFSLPFPLLSDEEGKVVEAYDVWGEKEMYGRKFFGIFRTTFLINEKGKVQVVISLVESKNHSEQIIELLK